MGHPAIAAPCETEFYDDLKSIDVPVMVMHGEDDQIVPLPASGAKRIKLLKHATLKSCRGFRMGRRLRTGM